MDPDFDIHLSDENEFAADASAADMAKSHFLDSIGIRDLVEDRQKAGPEDEAGTPDGVVLSSMPDDLGFPTAEFFLRGWDVPGIDLKSEPRLSPDAISLPEEGETAPQPEPMDRDKSARAEADPEEVLDLHCPSCRGALVLKRRHLGIEGACVWCHTAIVAAESPQDRSVRIFPISPKTPQEPVVETDNSKTDNSTTIEASPAELTPAPIAPIGEVKPMDAVHEVASADESFGSGFSSWMAPPQQEASETIEAKGITAMPDLDSLYETSGFLTPSVPPTEPAPLPPGFGETIDTPAKAAEETEVAIPSGFGAFLQNPVSRAKAEPSADSEFAAPVPWGPPAKQPVAEAPVRPVSDLGEPPMALEGEAGNDFPSPWGASPPPRSEDEVHADGFGAPRAESDFAPGASEETPAGAAPSDFSFANLPDREKPTEFSANDSERSYTTPLHGFSTGSSKEAKPVAMESGISGLTSVPARSWSQPGDEAPAALEPITEAPPHASGGVAEIEATPFEVTPVEGPSLFGAVRTELPASPFAPQPAPAPVVTSPLGAPSAQIAPPPIPGAPASLEVPPLPIGPQVISQPLGAKEKPKVRKGFLILMVVIVGFASGAALASFVLPVEEYVASARAYMEEKFNPGATAHQIPALPSLVGAEEADPDLQP